MTETNKMGFLFPSEVYTIQEFLQIHECEIPLILNIQEGYLGCDESMHAFSSGELYLLYTIKKQPRVILRDIKERNIAVPRNYHRQFQVVRDDRTLSPAKSLSDMVDKVLKKKKDTVLIFDRNESVSYQIGCDIGSSEKMGRLRYFDTYDEKYLVIFTMTDTRQRLRQPASLPVYLDVRVNSAIGLTDGDREQFRQTIKGLTPLPEEVNLDKVDVNHDIILLPDTAKDGDYEYLKPITWTKDGMSEHEYRQFAGSKGQKITEYAPPPPTRLKHGVLPDRSDRRGLMKSGKPNKSLSFRRLPATPPEENAYSETPTPSSRSQVSQRQYAVVTTPDTHTSRSVESDTRGVRPSCGFSTLGKVPKDLSNLTVSEVAQCLRLLKLSEGPVQKLMSEDVDGCILESLDEDILQTDLGLTKFEAVKLNKFINGWRPKE